MQWGWGLPGRPAAAFNAAAPHATMPWLGLAAGTSAIYGGVANIDSIDNLGDFGRYVAGYLQYHVADSEGRALTGNSSMYINE